MTISSRNGVNVCNGLDVEDREISRGLSTERMCATRAVKDKMHHVPVYRYVDDNFLELTICRTFANSALSTTSYREHTNM